jgi:hypothetical protein
LQPSLAAELGFRGTQLLRLVIHDRLNQTDTLILPAARAAQIDDSDCATAGRCG